MTKYFSTKVLTTYFLSLVLFFSFLSATAQNSDPPPYLNPDFGPDSVSRLQVAYNLSNMAEYMKIDLPLYALAPWKYVFETAPKAKENIYIVGAKIYQYLLEKNDDPANFQGLYDTLMLIYDQRIQYFGNEGFVLGRKAVDIIEYNEADYPQAYRAFLKSAELSGIEASLNVITGLLQTSSVMLNNNLIETGDFLSNYFLCKDIITGKKESGKSIPSVLRAEKSLGKILDDIKINDCVQLEAFFRERISKDESNVELMRITTDLLTASGCENSAFFAEVNESLLNQNPDPDLAYKVAKFNLNNENFEAASKYLLLAIGLEKNNEKRAQYQYQLSIIYMAKLNNPKDARYYALQSIESKSDWGDPYFIVAAASVEGVKTCNTDEFSKQAINWLAVDYCIKAKSVDPSVTQKANDLIENYKSGFPNHEETFFRSLQEGDSYTFNCWFNESTRVKTR